MAGLVPEDKIAQVRESTNIVDIIGAYVNLRKTGNNYVGLCPFHPEKTPSFTVSMDKSIFYCFGCQTGGNVFSFLMRMENLPFHEALARLAARAGIALPQRNGKRGTTKSEEIFRLNAQVADYYHQLLTEKEEGSVAREYLDGRGVTAGTIKEYKLGYALKSWDGCLRFINQKGLSLELAASVGLIIQAKDSERFYDRFRDRIIFPLQDVKGRVLGFGGRSLGEEMPKYMNSPDSVIYRKGDNLYGLQVAETEIKTKGWAILVEGYFDLLALHQQGMKNVVATLGTGLTERQVELISQICSRVVILLDGDEAGKKAAHRGLKLLLNARPRAEVVLLPPGEDPDSFIRKVGKDGFLLKLAEAKPFEHFLVDYALEDLDPGNPSHHPLAVERLRGHLAEIKDNLKLQQCADRLAERLQMKGFGVTRSARVFFPHLDRLAGRLLATRGELKGQHEVASLNEEELLVTIMLQDGHFIERAKELEIIKEIANPALKKIVEMLILKYGGGADPSKLIDELEEDSLKGVVSRLSLVPNLGEETGTAFADCVKKLALRRTKQRERELAVAIKEAEQKGDSAQLSNLLKEKIRLKDHLKNNLFREQ